MPLQVLSGVAQVVASLPGPGRLELYAVKLAGSEAPALVVEGYDATTMVAGGTVAVWELNQAIAALLSSSVQARRLALRDDGRAHGGHLDVVADGGHVDVVVSGNGGRVSFETTAEAFVHDLNALVHHYLTLSRAAPGVRTIVLPDTEAAARQPIARAALTRPAPK
ncbi:MAG TPA: hypothetical protein VNQ77_09480 [Frankiaceae bacterium]|nr:hypothetical protein [Frankiaceae bacterium]